jgi:two-component system sensor histidine kinase YesM
MFRYAVGSQGDLVNLEQELAHVRNYLLIQQNRFAGRCEVRVHAEPVVLAARIPRFTLQPLVENAFEHGLQKKPGVWRLEVSCSSRRRGALLVVRDNGVGMPRGRLLEVRAHLRDAGDAPPGENASIGLRNVDTRLRLHFGARHGIRICSNDGAGTTVVAILPATAAEPEARGETASTGEHHG